MVSRWRSPPAGTRGSLADCATKNIPSGQISEPSLVSMAKNPVDPRTTRAYRSPELRHPRAFTASAGQLLRRRCQGRGGRRVRGWIPPRLLQLLEAGDIQGDRLLHGQAVRDARVTTGVRRGLRGG